MYAETGVSSPYMQKISQDFQLFEEFCETRKPNASMMSTISDYYLGGEGDLFKAPEPIIEEPIVGYDPVTSTISLSLCGEVGFTSQGLKAADIESIQNEQLLEVLYECEKDLMAKAVIETPLSEKSVSSDCLSSMEWTQGAATKPNFLNFPGMDLDSANGMRRAFSEGDIKTLGNGNLGQRPIMVSSCSVEDRKEKLSRYRNKKAKRKFGRKINYACRKVLADNQPRIRGRFAKIEESDNSKSQ